MDRFSKFLALSGDSGCDVYVVIQRAPLRGTWFLGHLADPAVPCSYRGDRLRLAIRLIRREEIFLSPPSPPAPNVSDNLASPVVPVRRVLHSDDLRAPSLS